MRRRIPWATLAALVLATALAQPTPGAELPQESARTLGEALALAPDNSAAVLTARTDLAAAERDLARVEQDPYALRLDTLQAHQALESAQVALEVTLQSLEIEVAEAYFGALEADDALASAQMQRDLAVTTLEAMTVRHDAGAATDLELEGAKSDLAAAERGVRDAQQSRDLAYQNLASLLGVEVVALTPVTVDTSLQTPGYEQLLAEARDRNAQLLAALRELELAQVQLEAVDNAFSARSDVEAAQAALDSAQTRLEDTLRSLVLSIRQSYNALLATQGRYEGALESYQASLQDLEAQRTRLEAGSISPLAYQQAEVTHADTSASLAAALHDVALARMQLEQAVLGQ